MLPFLLPVALGIIGLFAWSSYTRRRTPCVWEIERADGTTICVPAEIGDQGINMVAQASEICPKEEGFYDPFIDAFQARIVAGADPRASLETLYQELKIICPTIRPPRF